MLYIIQETHRKIFMSFVWSGYIFVTASWGQKSEFVQDMLENI